MSVARLFDARGYGIGLEILGYEFPELADVPYDSNWLQVRVDVRYPEGRWQGIDPCLLTYEARELADWLDAVADKVPVSEELRFTEPLLGFSLPTPSLVRVLFWHPIALRDYRIDLPRDGVDLTAAARELRAALCRYPQRTHP